MPEMDLETLIQGVKDRNRRMIAKTMTLIESRVPAHQEMAAKIMEQILPMAGNSTRLGVTGVPGVGKSTFIENLGVYLADAGHQVAVLAVDPSSGAAADPFWGTRPGWKNWPPMPTPLSARLLPARP